MERLRSIAVGTALGFAALGVVGGVVLLASPPPDTEIGSLLHVDAGPAAVSVTPTPSDAPTSESSDSATEVPNAPPVEVDDDRDDDDRDDDDRDDDDRDGDSGDDR